MAMEFLRALLLLFLIPSVLFAETRPGQWFPKLQISPLPPLDPVSSPSVTKPPPPSPRPVRPVPSLPPRRTNPPKRPAVASVFHPVGKGAVRYFGHHDAVRTLDVSEDQTRIISGSEDHTLRLWDSNTGEELRRLVSKGGSVERVHFVPGKNAVLAISRAVSSGVAYWDLDSPSDRPAKTLALGGGYDEDLAFSPDSQLFALTGYKKIYVVRLPDFSAVAELPTQDLSTTRLLFSPDGKTLWAGDSKGRVASWDVATWSHRKTFTLPPIRKYDGGRVQGLAASPEGDLLYVLSSKQWCALDPNKGWVGEPRTDWDGQAQALHPSGHALAYSDYSNEIFLVDPQKSRPIAKLRGHRGRIYDLHWINPHQLLSASHDGSMVRWDLNDLRAQGSVGLVNFDVRATFPVPGPIAPVVDEKTLTGHIPQESVAGISATFSEDGAYLAAGYSGKLRVYRKGQTEHFLEKSRVVGQGQIHAFVPHTQTLIYLDKAMVRQIQLPSGESQNSFPVKAQGWPNNIEVHPDGSKFVLSSGYGTLDLYDRESTARLQTQFAQREVSGASETKIYGLKFSPDGTQLLAGGTDGIARLYDADLKELLLSLQDHEHAVTDVGFLPEGKGFLTTSQDKLVRWWDASGNQIRTGAGHSQGVLCLAQHKNLLATGGADGAIIFWDQTTGRKLLRLDTLNRSVDYLAISPDGETLVAAGENSGQRIYPMGGLRTLFAPKTK